MKALNHRSNSPRIVSFAIPNDWTAEQALAVFELLDDLSAQIWARYGLQIQETIREQRLPSSIEQHSLPFDDPPF
jgi:hypothetical protein